MVWLPRWGCDGMITSAQKMMMARAGAKPLAVAWDVTRIVEPEDLNYRRLTYNTPYTMGTSGDGNYLYQTVSGDYQVARYGMAAPYDVESLAFQGYSYSINSEVGNVRDGLQVVNSGQTAIGCVNGSLRQVTLTTPYSTATAEASSGITFDWSANVTDPRSIYVKPDGTEVYTINGGTSSVSRFTLTTSFDVSTASHTSTTTLGVSNCSALWFKPDGTKLYVVRGRSAGVDGSVREYTLSTAWDTSTIGAATTRNIPYAGSSLWDSYGWNGLFFSEAGDAFFAFRASAPNRDANAGLFKYDLSTAWDLTTATFSFGPDVYEGEIAMGQFKPDGTKIYSVNGTTDSVVEYDMSTALDITTISVGSSFSVSGQTTTPRDVKFSPDGTKMFVIGPNYVFGYELSTAWDVTSASYSSNAFSFSAKESNGNSLGISEDGTVMMVTGYSTDKIHQYDLSTAWDLTTATFTATSSRSHNNPQMFWKTDGSRVTFSNNSAGIRQFNLSTPWDITTMTTGTVGDGNYDYTLLEYGNKDIIWGPDGTFVLLKASHFDITIKLNLA